MFLCKRCSKKFEPCFCDSLGSSFGVCESCGDNCLTVDHQCYKNREVRDKEIDEINKIQLMLVCLQTAIVERNEAWGKKSAKRIVKINQHLDHIKAILGGLDDV